MHAHETVLHRAAVDALGLTPDAVVVDATLGAGGHAREILTRLDERGVLIALDADAQALEDARSLEAPNVHLVHANFRDIDTVLGSYGVDAADAILADLGWRMEQFEESGRGFSFRNDESLSMTYGEPEHYPFTARDIVNEWPEDSIRNVLRGYGEERYAGRIAKAIVNARRQKPIERTSQLTDIVLNAVPKRSRHGRIHPATRTYQALRIAVNDEIEALEEFIKKAMDCLAPGGRLVIITFHSIEDRAVKQAFKNAAQEGVGTIETKKPIRPTKEEVANNPRSRSAKMRIFKKT